MKPTIDTPIHVPPTIVVDAVTTPVGDVRLAAHAEPESVLAVAFGDHFDAVRARVERAHPGSRWVEGTTAAGVAIERYLAGDLHALDDVAVAPSGTAFQRRVWAALREIPVGETRSYGEVAAAIGAAGAVRAVGTANGANPLWLVVPCHRVIRGDGSLGGYGGGVHRKAWLLRHEGVAHVTSPPSRLWG